MKLTQQEQATLASGDRQITRKVQVNKRTGRERGISTRVGDTFKVNGRYLAVCSIKKERGTPSQWIIKFEDVGEWAMAAEHDGPIEMTLAEVKERLPTKLTWPKEPGTKAGDIFVFQWGYAHAVDEQGQKHEKPFPDVFLRVLSNPVRHVKGHWWATYEPVGFEKVEWLRRGHGTTTNPHESIDPDAPVEVVKVSPAEAERNIKLARERRSEREKARTPRDRRPWRQAA